MVNLFITGSIHTNDGKRIPVEIDAIMDKSDPMRLLEHLVVKVGYVRSALGNMRINIVVKCSPNRGTRLGCVCIYGPKTAAFVQEILNSKKEGIPSISQMAANLQRWNDSRPTMAQVEENCKRWGRVGLQVKDFS